MSFRLKLCVHLKVSFENAYFRECSQIICLLENNFRNFSFQIDDKKTHPKFLNSQNLINRFVLTLCCFSYSHFKLRHSRQPASRYTLEILFWIEWIVRIDSHIETNLENFRSQSIERYFQFTFQRSVHSFTLK